MTYTWFLFDADDTLFDYDKAEVVALSSTFAQFGCGYDPAYLDAYHTINAQLWRDFERGAIKQELIKTLRFARLFDAIGLTPAPDLATFSARYLENLGSCTFLIDGAETVIAVLRGVARLGVITNGLQVVQRGRIARVSIGDAFEVVVISEEVGCSKPHATIFDVAFAQMSHPRKDEVLMIGDSLTSDIKGGSDYGIDTCWYNPSGAPRPQDVTITYEIRALRELLSLFCPGLCVA
ncbi:MAG TPA: YjjG family noncanonical pyrimidine nucleotidase [Anaerolineae bacterium]|nr:YjjG family noncanonical pyrimidine nucleotidase [Anaerolineae bacterium]HQI83676.1 YjjG family noncanonical pyrimidine nucleotidase [Anaerolineae bacterium]